MAKKKTKPGAKAESKRASETSEAIHLFERAINRWSESAVSASRLASAGNLNPREWAKTYSEIWKDASRDMGRFLNLCLRAYDVRRR